MFNFCYSLILCVLRYFKRLKKCLGRTAIKYNEIIGKIRHVNLKPLSINFTPLFLVLLFSAIRLSIIGFPSPESGERYYETGLVFDEVYYVKAARFLLKGKPVNNEHPPLVKLLIMTGIFFFGDNPIGWRLPTIIFSLASLILLYVLSINITGNRLASFVTIILFAFDPMAFNIGQIAMLDAPSLTFILIACIMLIKSRYNFCGTFFGLAMLCKLSAFFSLGIILFLLIKVIVENSGAKLSKLIFKWLFLLARIFLLSSTIFLFGIWIYDIFFGVFSYNPLNHIIYMFNYHSTLQYQSLEDIIHPLKWINPLSPFTPIPYYVVAEREIIDGRVLREYHPIAYYCIYSPLWWSIWIIVPLSLKEIIEGREDLSPFILMWIVANFVPYVLFAYILRRWVYPFYFYSTLPGLYMGLSHYLMKSRKLKTALISLLSLQITWFIIWFPVKPKFLVDLLSSLNLPV